MEKIISIVTGSNGFIGSHLVQFLLNKGHRVKCIVRPTSNLKWIEHLDVECIPSGLLEVETLSKVFQNARYIFHLAGSIKAKKYEDFVAGNVGLTENVLQAARGNSSIRKIIITSSLAASAPALINIPVTEETRSNTISKYGKSKKEMEDVVYSKYKDLPYTIIRPPVVYGPRDTEVLLFFKTVKKGIIPTIGIGEKQVSLVYIDDLIEGMYLAAIKEEALQQTYFIVSDQLLNWLELGHKAAKILGKKTIRLIIPHFLVYIIAGLAELGSFFQTKAPTMNLEKAKEITQVAWTCSEAKARKELGFIPKVGYKEGFATTLKWYQNEGWI